MDARAGSRRARVAVVGSFNMDLVFQTPRRPEAGETIVGSGFGTFIGGKGANQAVAAARAGAQVSMIGRLGTDAFGDAIFGALSAEGIDLAGTVRDAESGTGVAGIIVESNGSNSIVVAPQANARLTVDDVQRAAAAIQDADVLLLQLEVPLEVCVAAAAIARSSGTLVILNPAPACDLPAELLASVDFLTPNESEMARLTGQSVGTDAEAAGAARRLLSQGVGMVLLTLGERGALIVTQESAQPVPSFPVQVVDTTAAGDAFCGALAVALAEGRPLLEVARFACAAGALAVTVMGAMPSLPQRAAIERLMTVTESGLSEVRAVE